MKISLSLMSRKHSIRKETGMSNTALTFINKLKGEFLPMKHKPPARHLCHYTTVQVFVEKARSVSRHTFSWSSNAVLLFPIRYAAAGYTSEPAWLWAGTMTATAPMRVRVEEEPICGDTVSGGGTWGWAPLVLLGMTTTGLLRTCGGAPFALGGRLCLREGVPPML